MVVQARCDQVACLVQRLRGIDVFLQRQRLQVRERQSDAFGPGGACKQESGAERQGAQVGPATRLAVTAARGRA